ncbi:hypothetical protein ATZ36_16340 [Candidatus Endomicrobiellum trichonymphae]|uniref:Uncharacterized protein n=1 Tax=Endomicrobium trichonymphae TaxID=1408204 RepID=A0A1E5IL18_ENDTX|nr:hypothetical protein ATZ36_16340 [Candidatus Endomicrobium trichonymphae]
MLLAQSIHICLTDWLILQHIIKNYLKNMAEKFWTDSKRYLVDELLKFEKGKESDDYKFLRYIPIARFDSATRAIHNIE